MLLFQISTQDSVIYKDCTVSVSQSHLGQHVVTGWVRGGAVETGCDPPSLCGTTHRNQSCHSHSSAFTVVEVRNYHMQWCSYTGLILAMELFSCTAWSWDHEVKPEVTEPGGPGLQQHPTCWTLSVTIWEPDRWEMRGVWTSADPDNWVTEWVYLQWKVKHKEKQSIAVN